MKNYNASIIVPVSNDCNILEYFIEHLKQTVDIIKYQFIFVVDGPVSNNIKQCLENFSKEYDTVFCFYLEKKSSYAHVNNYGRLHAKSSLLIFMNTDIFIKPNCLETMIASLSENHVQAVQPLLIYPQSNLVQSTGHIFCDCYNRHALKGRTLEHKLVKKSDIRQALSLALCLIPSSIFDEMNGFNEYYYNGWEGLELTLKITHKGYLCWYESSAQAYHVEGGSRKQYHLSQDLQSYYFWSEWGKKVHLDIIDIIQKQLKDLLIPSKYLVYNFTSYRSWKNILDTLYVEYDYIIDKTEYSAEEKLDFFSVLSYYILTYPEPIIFLVTSFSALKENSLWIKYRKCCDDIFIDLSGNADKLENIVCGN